MIVKVSKVFARFIQQATKEKGLDYEVSVEEFRPEAYSVHGGDLFLAEQYGDMDWSKGIVKVIKVLYPENYYALPRYLSTAELNHEYKARNVTDIKELKDMIIDLIAA